MVVGDTVNSVAARSPHARRSKKVNIRPWTLRSVCTATRTPCCPASASRPPTTGTVGISPSRPCRPPLPLDARRVRHSGMVESRHTRESAGGCGRRQSCRESRRTCCSRGRGGLGGKGEEGQSTRSEGERGSYAPRMKRDCMANEAEEEERRREAKQFRIPRERRVCESGSTIRPGRRLN